MNGAYGPRLFIQALRLQIGNGAGHAQHAMQPASRQSELRTSLRQEPPPMPIQAAGFLRIRTREVHVENSGARVLQLAHPAHAFDDARAGPFRVSGRRLIQQLFARHRRHFDAQIDAIEQRSGNARPIARDFTGRAAAAPDDSPRYPHGHGFMAATSWNRAGYSTRSAARAIATTPVSSGSRSDSSTARWNSGSSSRNRTP